MGAENEYGKHVFNPMSSANMTGYTVVLVGAAGLGIATYFRAKYMDAITQEQRYIKNGSLVGMGVALVMILGGFGILMSYD